MNALCRKQMLCGIYAWYELAIRDDKSLSSLGS